MVAVIELFTELLDVKVVAFVPDKGLAIIVLVVFWSQAIASFIFDISSVVDCDLLITSIFELSENSVVISLASLSKLV